MRLAVTAIACALAGVAVSPAVGVAQARPHKHVCGSVNPHFLRCASDVVTTSSGVAAAASGPTGYNPSDLLSAYGLASAAASAGSGQTVAIVDAYDDPNAESDLGVYRSQFGLAGLHDRQRLLPQGQPDRRDVIPAANSGWAQEISLDLDMVSAICPNCHILLVEASSNSDANLYTAENEAAALGATQISNSWSGGEYSGETSDSSTYFKHTGIAITVAAGDSGYGSQFPTASQYVTAVGGTSLTKASGTQPRGWSETAWSGGGSGCSAYITKPSWQTDSGCTQAHDGRRVRCSRPEHGRFCVRHLPVGRMACVRRHERRHPHHGQLLRARRLGGRHQPRAVSVSTHNLVERRHVGQQRIVQPEPELLLHCGSGLRRDQRVWARRTAPRSSRP